MHTLYIYDHCPYCVKARMIFGLKNVPVQLKVLLNDDEATPHSMISKKMVPILAKEDGTFLPESMDIIRTIDALDGKPIVTSSPGNSKLDPWYAKSRQMVYQLCMPRWVQAPLEEFATQEARAYFIAKKEAMIGSFQQHLANSPELIRLADELLKELDVLIDSLEFVHGELSEDDIHLFAVLRSLSIVKGITYPQNVEKYRQHLSQISGVPLLDGLAI
ncbi:MAG: glutaredoxin 2 [Alphaproteobacteria bacterium]|nr:glutaredoxin 2 [Alphaproteobacteria bacterium]